MNAVVPLQAPVVPFDTMKSMAAVIARSRLFGMQSDEQVLALMLLAQAEGRHPALVARDYDIIQGRPAKKSEAMLRDFLTAGGKVQWHTLSDVSADATFSHPEGGEVRISWDMSRAKQAGLGGKDMWSKYPRQMLRSRCVSEGVRTVWPMATSGMYVPEEVKDFERDPPKPVAVQPERQTIDVQAEPVLEDKALAAPERISESELADSLTAIRECETLEALKGAYNGLYARAKRVGDDEAIKALRTAKDARKAELDAPAAESAQS